MAGQRLKRARTVAIEVLNRCDPKKNYTGPILDKLLPKTDQRRRATDLVFGTIRNRRAIDTVITRFSGCPLERISDRLLNIIRIGVYELIYTPATEEYSIVNEAVESAKAVAGKKQVGFVNAVLRQVTKHTTNRQIRLPHGKARSTLPQTCVTGCEFDTCFLPDCETSPVDYLSTVFSLPKWLVDDWLGGFGEESTLQVCFASNRRPSIYIRTNRLRTTTQDLAEKFRREGIELEIVPEREMMRIKSPRAITQLPGFAEGEFTVQDITASQGVRLLNPQPNWTILDLCAAPGAKTTQLAEAAGDLAKIVATDIDSRRLEMVKENVARLGIKSVTAVAHANLQSIATGIGPFDAILLDVPCSNTGVLARRIETRYRVSQKAMNGLSRVQGELLGTAAKMVKPLGKICYSTCSIQRAENSEVIAEFLQQNPTFELESENLTLPSAEGFDHDGGYTAILVKK
ncbi:MAG: transcription antitermination factor NusB [Phycisphaerales bacterium]|jgi:16S rRNA (cytosine967-C5)-methyltransferase